MPQTISMEAMSRLPGLDSVKRFSEPGLPEQIDSCMDVQIMIQHVVACRKSPEEGNCVPTTIHTMFDASINLESEFTRSKTESRRSSVCLSAEVCVWYNCFSCLSNMRCWYFFLQLSATAAMTTLHCSGHIWLFHEPSGILSWHESVDLHGICAIPKYRWWRHRHPSMVPDVSLTSRCQNMNEVIKVALQVDMFEQKVILSRLRWHRHVKRRVDDYVSRTVIKVQYRINNTDTKEDENRCGEGGHVGGKSERWLSVC